MQSKTSTTRKVQYLSGASGRELQAAVAEGLEVGLLVQPKSNHERHIAAHRDWAADNGKFTTTDTPFDPDQFRSMLRRPELMTARESCLFVVAPDELEVLPDGTVIGDAVGTLAAFTAWAREIQGLGYPVALVAQDGLELMLDQVEWDLVDVLFLGGSTEWKEGPGAHHCARIAKAEGKRVHMGRVNSGRRLAIAARFGCDTADGTFLGYGPSRNIPRMLRWPNLLKEGPVQHCYTESSAGTGPAEEIGGTPMSYREREQQVIDRVNEHHRRVEANKEARAWYGKGWTYSGRETATLEWGDRNGYPDAWYCGYLDYAAGRERGHLLTCAGCEEHPVNTPLIDSSVVG
jgi:hypothetical protein